jgi:mannose-6-phosphate isomerase-like protein (cupin superfamily)
MAVKDQVLDLSPIGMIFTVIRPGADTGGRSLDLHWELLPYCNMKDPLVHVHPHAIETYEILDGEMEFFVKDRWVLAKKGDKLTVEKGVTHAFRNHTAGKVHVYNTHEPAFEMESYFEDVSKVLDKITKDRTRSFTMNLKTMLYMSVLMNNYRHEIIARKPPDVAIRILGLVSRVLGIRY